jgi:hypothetical protein
MLLSTETIARSIIRTSPALKKDIFCILRVLPHNSGYHLGMGSSHSPIVVSAAVLSQLFLYLSSRKVDIDRFLHSLGANPDEIRSPDAYLPVETYLRIEEEAARFVHDPYLGLHAGEYFEPGSWSILGYMMMNCRTLGEALEKSKRYSRIIGNVIDTDVKLRWKSIRIVFSHRSICRRCPGIATKPRFPALCP